MLRKLAQPGFPCHDGYRGFGHDCHHRAPPVGQGAASQEEDRASAAATEVSIGLQGLDDRDAFFGESPDAAANVDAHVEDLVVEKA